MKQRSEDSDAQTRALERMLFRLTAEELFQLGITQIDTPDGPFWAVAWSDDSSETEAAVSQALQPEHVIAGGSCSHGRCGWYVPREKFFRARKALLGAKEVAIRKVQLTEPKLKVR